METSKVARIHQAHKKKPQSEDRHMSRRAGAELSDPTDQDMRNREVENTPYHVYGRRRQSLARWAGKGTLKGSTHRPAHEVWNGVAEKNAAEEVRDAMRPFHRESCLSLQKWTFGKLREFTLTPGNSQATSCWHANSRNWISSIVHPPAAHRVAHDPAKPAHPHRATDGRGAQTTGDSLWLWLRSLLRDDGRGSSDRLVKFTIALLRSPPSVH